MDRVSARKILDIPNSELWNGLVDKFILVFDDGEIVADKKEVIYSSYAWTLHKLYPNTPLLIKHLINFKGTQIVHEIENEDDLENEEDDVKIKTKYVSNARLGTNTHLKLINTVLWSVFDAYKYNVPNKTKLIDDLTKQSYVITNKMFNELSYILERYTTSLDIIDFINVTSHPELVAATKNMPATQEGIDEVYNVVKRLFKEDPSFQLNPMVNAVNGGQANIGQALQCVAPRGFLTDIDSNIFQNPIKSGFVEGITKFEDSLIETRSAAKALIFSTDPLQQSEYFSRRQQLICQNVKNIHSGDCGSQEYLAWHIRDVRKEGNIKINDCDLTTLQGKYYLDEVTNTLKVLSIKDEHLIGKTIRLRSPIAGCKCTDPYGICETCYGETALSIPENSNLGHITCVTMTGKLGQNILSTKHFDGSSVVEGVVLKPHEKKYLSSNLNSSVYFLNSSLKSKKVELLFTARNVSGLTDITLVDDVEKLSLSRISEFEDICIIVTNLKTGEIDTAVLNVSVAGRFSSMTYDMLRYVKEKGWKVNAEGNYVLDVSNYDFSKAFLVLPMRHVSMSQHQNIK
jgi:hypothetical protein